MSLQLFKYVKNVSTPFYRTTTNSRRFSQFVRPALPITSSRVTCADAVYDGFCDAVGNTSLIKLQGPSQATGCNIYGKAEFENPGGSVKDRAALFIINDFEKRGLLVPGRGDIIVEGTAGNTGIGLTYVANARGHRMVIVMADINSQEKKNTLRWAGAELVEVPAVPFRNPNNYVHVTERLSRLIAQQYGFAVVADQWGNPANKQAHVETTGPEIWAQTQGKIDAFSCAMGTGGTLAGMASYLRAKNSRITIALTDCEGSILHRFYSQGKMELVGSSISEGIGQGRLTGQMHGFKPDMSFEVTDAEMLPVLYDLLEHEGLSLGGSSGINVAGAIKVARALGPGHTIVTVLCDAGTRYASKLYNPSYLRSRGLMVPRWLDEPQAASPTGVPTIKLPASVHVAGSTTVSSVGSTHTPAVTVLPGYHASSKPDRMRIDPNWLAAKTKECLVPV